MPSLGMAQRATGFSILPQKSEDLMLTSFPLSATFKHSALHIHHPCPFQESQMRLVA